MIHREGFHLDDKVSSIVDDSKRGWNAMKPMLGKITVSDDWGDLSQVFVTGLLVVAHGLQFVSFFGGKHYTSFGKNGTTKFSTVIKCRVIADLTKEIQLEVRLQLTTICFKDSSIYKEVKSL
ncbi:hypothetical protein L6452_25494 [Arctium lappa]|uniref:Uncharacterized protein n=1 Tax=Arctium lappa TaxID=4217 RepID=A0ACB9ABH0_ARCLA|nr:hypothetical protein L6452_25494 [Arctium lappa]